MNFANSRVNSSFIFLCGLLLGSLTLAYPPDPDAPLFFYLGKLLLEGGVPYRDAVVFDNPGLSFFYALSLLLFGKSGLGLRVLDVLWQSGTAVAVGVIARRLTQRWSAGLTAGVAYLLAYYAIGARAVVHGDALLSLPFALAFLVLLRALESDRLSAWFGAALWLGLATLFKITTGVFGVAMLVVALAGWKRDRGRVVRRLATLALGFGLPLAACVAFFYLKGGLAEFWRDQFVLGPQYVERMRPNLEVGLLKLFSRPFEAPLYAMALMGAALALSWRREEKIPRETWMVLAWLAAAAAGIYLHGSYIRYHFTALIAPLAVWGAQGFEAARVWQRQGGMTRKLAVALVIVLFVGYPAERSRQHIVFTLTELKNPAPLDRWRVLGAYLKGRTQPEDRIFVWGNPPSAAVYLEADRKPASRFIQTSMLAVPWRGVNLRSEFLAEFRANKPCYFVLAPNAPPDGSAPVGSLEAYQHFPALKNMIDSEYVVETTEDYIVYRRREPGSPGRRSLPGQTH